jgi:hypothetical protein
MRGRLTGKRLSQPPPPQIGTDAHVGRVGCAHVAIDGECPAVELSRHGFIAGAVLLAAVTTADRQQFYAFAAYPIRLILLNRVRERRTAKRVSGVAAVRRSDQLPGADAASGT